MLLEITVGGWKLQVRSLEVEDPKLFRYPFRMRWTEGDLNTLSQIFVQGGYDYPFGFEPRSVIDAGAHIGCAAVWFGQKFPGARVIALEPAVDNFELLSANTRRFANITPVQAALAKESGEVQLVTRDPSGRRPFATDAYHLDERVDPSLADAYRVKAVTLGEVFTVHGLRELDILKIDIEGTEVEVLSEANDAYLARTRVVIVEPHDRFRAGCTAAIHAAATRHGFSISSLGECLYLTREPLAGPGELGSP